MNRRVLSMTALAVLTAFSLTACGGSKPATENTPAPAAGQPVQGGTYTAATVIDATFINPILNQDAFSSTVNDMVFDSLLRLNEKQEWIPWLATELPKIEDEGKKWTFKLRDGVKWHDGQAFSSEDVEFTFAAILHPTYTGVRASGLTAIKGATALRDGYKAIDADVKAGKLIKEEGDQKKVESWDAWRQSDAIDTPDKNTVVFLFDKAFAPAMVNIAGRNIIPQHILKDEVGAKMKDSKFNREAPVGTGRYQFVEWKTNERIVLKANESWWGGRPNIDQYIWRVFPDQNTAMAALEKGEIDRADIQIEQFDRFTNDVKNVQVYEYATTNYRNIAFDLKNPLFADKKVRHALANALDKETLVKQLLQGHGLTAWSHGTPTRWDFSENVKKFEYSKDLAKKQMEEAGWKPGPDGILVKDGQKFSFDLYFVSSNKIDAEAVQVIQAAWKEIGVEANLKGTDQPTLLDLSDAGNPNRKQPPAYLLGWSLGSEPDSYSIWACDGTFNDISYCNQEVHDLYIAGRNELDQTKRKAIYAQIQEKLAEDQPYIWLWFPNAIQGISKRVQGPIKGTPIGIEWNFEKWFIQPAK